MPDTPPSEEIKRGRRGSIEGEERVKKGEEGEERKGEEMEEKGEEGEEGRGEKKGERRERKREWR